MASVTWRESALDEAEVIARTIARDSPRAAAELVKRLFAATDNLELFPESGRVVPEFEHSDIREILVRPYRVIYVVSGDTVEVVSVQHGARRLGDIPGR
jgi:toxin ParE1/3/4